jgi:hypothetical protein
MVTYDFQVARQFEHMPLVTRENQHPTPQIVQYIGECREILELDYDLIVFPILLCYWV